MDGGEYAEPVGASERGVLFPTFLQWLELSGATPKTDCHWSWIMAYLWAESNLGSEA